MNIVKVSLVLLSQCLYTTDQNISPTYLQLTKFVRDSSVYSKIQIKIQIKNLCIVVNCHFNEEAVRFLCVWLKVWTNCEFSLSCYPHRPISRSSWIVNCLESFPKPLMPLTKNDYRLRNNWHKKPIADGLLQLPGCLFDKGTQNTHSIEYDIGF